MQRGEGKPVTIKATLCNVGKLIQLVLRMTIDSLLGGQIRMVHKYTAIL